MSEETLEQKVERHNTDVAYRYDLAQEGVGQSNQRTPERNIRRRIALSTSVKGIKTVDHTIETRGFTLEEALAEFKAQDAEVSKLYPVVPA